VSEALLLVLALIAGLMVGLGYFSGLRLTIQQLANSRRPARLAIVSFACRLVLMLLVLYLVSGNQWARIGLYLLGFFLIRTLLIWLWQPRISPLNKGAKTHGT
jgi:F1F0 ATPase subunit 2